MCPVLNLAESGARRLNHDMTMIYLVNFTNRITQLLCHTQFISQAGVGHKQFKQRLKSC